MPEVKIYESTGCTETKKLSFDLRLLTEKHICMFAWD